MASRARGISTDRADLRGFSMDDFSQYFPLCSVKLYLSGFTKRAKILFYQILADNGKY